MARLTGLDGAFLALESPTTHLHILGTMVLDPTGVPGGVGFRRIRSLVDERLPLVPPVPHADGRGPLRTPAPDPGGRPGVRPRLPRAPGRPARPRRTGGAGRTGGRPGRPSARPLPAPVGVPRGRGPGGRPDRPWWPRCTTPSSTGCRAPTCWPRSSTCRRPDSPSAVRGVPADASERRAHRGSTGRTTDGVGGSATGAGGASRRARAAPPDTRRGARPARRPGPVRGPHRADGPGRQLPATASRGRHSRRRRSRPPGPRSTGPSRRTAGSPSPTCRSRTCAGWRPPSGGRPTTWSWP